MKTAYIGGIILNGTEDMKPEHMSVIVENGRIVEILPADGLLPSDCEIVNIKGLYLMPGLINLHVHLNSGGKPSGKKKQPEDYVRLVKVATSNALTGEIVRSMSRGYAYMELQSGVTTIRTVGGISDYDGKIRNEIEEGVRLREKFTEDRLPGMKKHNLRSSLRAVRTGFTRIPAGPFAPDGVGAALRGSAAGSTQDRGKPSGADQAHGHRRYYGCGNGRGARRPQDVSGDHKGRLRGSA